MSARIQGLKHSPGKFYGREYYNGMASFLFYILNYSEALKKKIVNAKNLIRSDTVNQTFNLD